MPERSDFAAFKKPVFTCQKRIYLLPLAVKNDWLDNILQAWFKIQIKSFNAKKFWE